MKGFSLLEMTLLVAILGLLAAAALPIYRSYQADAERVTVAQLASALGVASAANYHAYVLKGGFAAGVVATADGIFLCDRTRFNRLLQVALPENVGISEDLSWNPPRDNPGRTTCFLSLGGESASFTHYLIYPVN